MCDCLSAHIGKQTIEVLEENFDPDNLFSCLKNPLYHSSLKGCRVEMIGTTILSGLTEVNGLIINKKCLTHNVMCSKTGWQLGYYNGTCSKDLNIKKFDYDVCECGRKFIKNRHHDFCHRCEPLKCSEEELKEKEKGILNDSRKQARIWHFKKQGLSDMEIDNIFREEDKSRLD